MTTNPYEQNPAPSSMPPEPPYRGYGGPSQPPAATEVPAGAPAGNTAPVQQAAAPYGAHPEHAAPVQPVYGAPGPYEDLQPNPYEGAHVASDGAAAAPRKSGGGKTFLFGFLGALLACALCLGGFALWQNANPSQASVSAPIGATDSSVIDAVEEGQTLAEAVAAKALPSVVAVYNYQEASASGLYGYGSNAAVPSTGALQQAGMGSGVVISADGYVITNYHVVDGAKELTITVDGEEREAVYVGGDSSSDIAVVKVDNAEGLVPVDIGNSDDLVIGEWVMTIGAPLGLEQSVATGVVSATNRSQIMDNSSSSNIYGYGSATPSYTYYPNMIQTDAVINPGNSGGALVDADGKLIGINTMISSMSGDYAGVGFAIPVNYAVGIAQDIIAGKEPTHAILGVSISSVNAQNAQRYGLEATSGAYVNAITPETGAASSDLKVGDIITAIDGKAVTSSTDVTLDVRAHAVGDTVTVTVNRDGQTLDIPVVLTSDENLTKNDAQEMDSQGQNQSPYGYSPDQREQLEELLRLFNL